MISKRYTEEFKKLMFEEYLNVKPSNFNFFTSELLCVLSDQGAIFSISLPGGRNVI